MNMFSFYKNPALSGRNKTKDVSFLEFIWNNTANRQFLMIAICATIIQYIIFKLLYPFPDFFSDSYSYIYAAYKNVAINIWPIGYSKFLRGFHFLTSSAPPVIAFQYFSIVLGALLLFFTICYHYEVSKLNRKILFVFLFFNPLLLYISNYINSDALFIALSLYWLTSLIWIVERPNTYLIVLQGILLFFCFTVRNNAYVYPFITLAAFSLSKQTKYRKIIGTALGIILIIPFVLYTRDAGYKLTGTAQFSLFTGWQLANNALYMYEYADTAKVLSTEGAKIDELAKQFYTMAPQNFSEDILYTNPGNFFIQSQWSPLKKYMDHNYTITDGMSHIAAWGKSSAIFNQYGGTVIRNNPGAYFWKFIIPNAHNYFFPALEKLQLYNLGEDSIGQMGVDWFKYKTARIHAVSKTAQGVILYAFRPLNLIIHVYMLLSLAVYLIKGTYVQAPPNFNRLLILLTVFLIANFAFCVSATIIVMRYQVFPMMTCFIMAIGLNQFMESRSPDNTNIKKRKLQINTSSR